jgi:hypothetical protein
MSTKDTYTAEEWEAITSAPVMAGSYIAMSDPGVTSLIGEMNAMMKAMTSGEIPAGAKDLVDSLVASVQERAKSGEKMEMPDISTDAGGNAEAAKAAMLAQIKQATDAVAAKGAAGEAAAFKQWIVSIANATAEAAREGGFMGIGGTRVSDEEKAAIADLQTAIGA